MPEQQPITVDYLLRLEEWMSEQRRYDRRRELLEEQERQRMPETNSDENSLSAMGTAGEQRLSLAQDAWNRELQLRAMGTSPVWDVNYITPEEAQRRFPTEQNTWHEEFIREYDIDTNLGINPQLRNILREVYCSKGLLCPDEDIEIEEDTTEYNRIQTYKVYFQSEENDRYIVLRGELGGIRSDNSQITYRCFYYCRPELAQWSPEEVEQMRQETGQAIRYNYICPPSNMIPNQPLNGYTCGGSVTDAIREQQRSINAELLSVMPELPTRKKKKSNPFLETKSGFAKFQESLEQKEKV